MPSINHIQEELTSLSQQVSQLPKSTPFAVPKDYFETFPDRQMGAIHHEASGQDLIELSPLIKSLTSTREGAEGEGLVAWRAR